MNALAYLLLCLILGFLVAFVMEALFVGFTYAWYNLFYDQVIAIVTIEHLPNVGVRPVGWFCSFMLYFFACIARLQNGKWPHQLLRKDI
jgi:hypothetical protein